MVGHTGRLEAAIAAIKTLDGCLARVIAAILAGAAPPLSPPIMATRSRCGTTLERAAHRAHDEPGAGDPGGRPWDRNPQPLAAGALCDIAPTMLALLELEPSKEMTGKDSAGKPSGRSGTRRSKRSVFRPSCRKSTTHSVPCLTPPQGPLKCGEFPKEFARLMTTCADACQPPGRPRFGRCRGSQPLGAKRAHPRSAQTGGSRPMYDVVIRFASELADSIAAAVSESAEVEACRERARAAGYEMKVNLEAVVGLSTGAGPGRQRRMPHPRACRIRRRSCHGNRST